jgi:hypothetical protein
MNRFIQATQLTTIALLLFSGVALRAQTITANITGTVTDSSGAIVSGAKVTATNADTNVQTGTTTNKDGIYDIRFLQVGRYTLTVETPGFATRMFGPFTLEANQNAKIDAQMSIAGTTAKVSVEAEAPLLNTENGTLATTLDTRAIDNIPLVGRNYAQLVLYVPGAVVTQPSGFTGNSAIGVGGTQASVNGNREQSNNYLLDGIEIDETLNNAEGYDPSPDALGQVQIVSANAQAEYGNVNGGDVVALTKSGTNRFHGSAFYYISDYKLNANTWAAGRNNPVTPKSSYTQPIYGGTLGGPILHDRLFFFGDYEGALYHLGGVGTATVATAKMRTGDFSELLGNLMCTTTSPCSSREIQLYDSTTTSYTRYANNQIPILNPVAQYLFSHPNLYPLPNQTPVANSGSPALNNYSAPTKTRKYNHQFDVKVDYKLKQSDNLSVRYSQSLNGSTTTPVLAIQFPVAPMEPIHGIAINEVHTFNSSMVNEFRAGYMRVYVEGGQPLDTTGVFGLSGNSIIGIPGGQRAPGFSGQVFSPISTTGVTTTNGSEYATMGNSDTATTYVDNSFSYGDNFTWTKDKHDFKFGVQFLRYQQNSLYPGNDGLLGSFNYTGDFTANPQASTTTNNPNGNNTQGYSMADFVLDRVTYVGSGSLPGSATGPTGQREWRDAYFVQDDWRITPSLTLNLGVRYEFDQPIYEVNNKMASVDFNTKQIVYAGQNGYSRPLVNPYFGGVMPRIGFAKGLTPRFVIRGGYGIQNYMEGTGANRRMNLNPPFTNAYAATATLPSVSTAGLPFVVQNGFASGGSGAITSSTTALNAWDPHIRPAFIGEYSLTTEYQVSSTASLKIGYVGESGQHLVNHGAANQLAAPCVISGVVQSNYKSAACIAADPAPFVSLVGQGGSVTITTSNAMMNYNALQATFRQRTWHGLEYTLNYTYGRAMTNAIGFFGAPDVNGANNYNENYYNNHAEYGPVGEDVRHNLSGTMVYDLPFGRGRMFGADMNRALDEVVGGWKVTFTAIAYTGFPVTINNTSNNADTDNKAQRANQYRALKIVNRSLTNWFGTDPSEQSCATAGVDNGVCAFGAPANGTYGDSSVNPERAPGYQQYDASLSKGFEVYREQTLEFRADAANVFNVVSLGNPNNTAQSSSFGSITSVRNGPRTLQLDLKYTF